MLDAPAPWLFWLLALLAAGSLGCWHFWLLALLVVGRYPARTHFANDGWRPGLAGRPATAVLLVVAGWAMFVDQILFLSQTR